jgi:hypothetical protein
MNMVDSLCDNSLICIMVQIDDHLSISIGLGSSIPAPRLLLLLDILHLQFISQLLSKFKISFQLRLQYPNFFTCLVF